MNRHTICITLFSLFIGGTALAEPAAPRLPLTPMKSTRVELNQFNRSHRVVRARGAGKTIARFSAEGTTIPANALLLFEAHSVAKSGYTLRWRCVAEKTVDECFSGPLHLRYLPQDQRIVLTVTPISVFTTQGIAILKADSARTLAQR